MRIWRVLLLLICSTVKKTKRPEIAETEKTTCNSLLTQVKNTYTSLLDLHGGNFSPLMLTVIVISQHKTFNYLFKKSLYFPDFFKKMIVELCAEIYRNLHSKKKSRPLRYP